MLWLIEASVQVSMSGYITGKPRQRPSACVACRCSQDISLHVRHESQSVHSWVKGLKPLRLAVKEHPIRLWYTIEEIRFSVLRLYREELKLVSTTFSFFLFQSHKSRPYAQYTAESSKSRMYYYIVPKYFFYFLHNQNAL